MIIFIGSALAAFLLSALPGVHRHLRLLARAPGRDQIAARAYEIYQTRGQKVGCADDDWLRAERELRFAVAVQIGLGVLLLVVPAIAFLAAYVLGYVRYGFTPPLVAPEAAQILLGLVFGLLLRCWLADVLRSAQPGSPTTSSKVAYVVWPVTLGVVLLLGLAPPYATALLERITRFKTPWIEIEAQFIATSAEQRAVFAVTRDQLLISSLPEVILRVSGIIEMDLDYVGLLSASPWTAERELASQDSAILLRQILAPVMQCAMKAQAQKEALATVQDGLRKTAQHMWRLVETRAVEPQRHKSFIVEATRSYATLCSLLEPSSKANHFGHPEIQREGHVLAFERWPAHLQNFSALTKAPYVHLAASHLLAFTGNLDGAIEVLQKAARTFPEDMNVHRFLARYLDAGGRELLTVATHLETALEIAERSARLLEQVRIPEERLARSRNRFARARSDYSNSLAYTLAQAGERVWTAKHYAAQNYASEPRDPVVIDTYGYTKLAFAARKTPRITTKSWRRSSSSRRPSPICGGYLTVRTNE